MESTAINTVYVVMSVNMVTNATNLLKVFGSMIEARKYKDECYKKDDESFVPHVFYILEEIVH